jgi:UDP-2,4-diacetamido-2,4,6-trideoxy-beta-L-altropyranose hydrolase|nr:UDP-2,4-diacetamido-2,4,6-trideoxy-beta-L-altropyranose hydrolase [Pseudomonas chengduensis]
MKIAFRADASLQMGSGHIMRCVTLADALKQKGAQCHFFCREHPGHLIELVRGKGHVVHVLPCETESPIDGGELAHTSWLGATQDQDAQACLPNLKELQPDWLIVDHYALDIRWEERMRPFCRRLMVIDDLADRTHQCDLLLDQNLGRERSDYAGLVPNGCFVLAGPQYALLRPEFAALREYSLERRKQPQIRRLLITMGGVDLPNATGKVLQALKHSVLSEDIRIDVVMGSKAPWLEEVREIARDMPWSTDVLVNITDMARRMADSDLAIGAAGGTSWERCCLGIPSLIIVVAENQWNGARALEEKHAVLGVLDMNDSYDGLEKLLFLPVENIKRISEISSQITHGTGVIDVIDFLGRHNV